MVSDLPQAVHVILRATRVPNSVLIFLTFGAFVFFSGSEESYEFGRLSCERWRSDLFGLFDRSSFDLKRLLSPGAPLLLGRPD